MFFRLKLEVLRNIFGAKGETIYNRINKKGMPALSRVPRRSLAKAGVADSSTGRASYSARKKGIWTG